MDQSPAGKVFVLSGPAGVGKGTLVAQLSASYPQLFVSVSCTTRAPRPGEVDGVHYHFVSEEQFDQLLASGGLLEWAQVHGRHRYGTPRAPVEQAITQGVTTLLEIDLQGARQVRASFPSAIQIFLLPPDWDELVRRLTGRGTENSADIERRLQTAKQELAAQAEFDHVVINNDRDQAVAQLAELMGLTQGAPPKS